MTDKKRRYPGFLLTTLFVFYFVGINFFNHTHLDENNRLIVHSHPFSSNTNHQHNSDCFFLIDRLTKIQSDLLVFGIMVYAFSYLEGELPVACNQCCVISDYDSFSFVRPPPVL